MSDTYPSRWLSVAQWQLTHSKPCPSALKLDLLHSTLENITTIAVTGHAIDVQLTSLLREYRLFELVNFPLLQIERRFRWEATYSAIPPRKRNSSSSPEQQGINNTACEKDAQEP